MSTFIDSLKQNTNETRTTNGDVAVRSTFNANLDFFGGLASKRGQNDLASRMFASAYDEDKFLAIKNLFYLRDVREGAGERELFRAGLRKLAQYDNDVFGRILPFVPEIGRWDDVVNLIEDSYARPHVLKVVKNQVNEDVQALNAGTPVSLLAKWMPSINAGKKSKEIAKILIKELKLTPASYRHLLSTLRKEIDLLETRLVNKDYTFDYSKIPGKAMLKYRKAFQRNDETRYGKFLDSLKTEDGLAKVASKTSTMMPYELISKVNRRWGSNKTDRDLANGLWSAMSKDTTGKKILTVLDTSGSMFSTIPGSSVTAYDVASSLAIYSSERLTGDFKDTIVTFSHSPRFVKLNAKDTLAEKVEHLFDYEEVSNTDIEKTYNLIFEAQKAAKPEDQVDYVLIISDLQFDSQTTGRVGKSTFDNIKQKFDEAGVKMPKMIYWNVMSRGDVMFPTTDIDQATFVSGFSKATFDGIMKAEMPDAVKFMKNVLSKYDYLDDFIRG